MKVRVVGALALLVASTLGVVASPPAGASDLSSAGASGAMSPLTWVDGAGLQYTLATVGGTGGTSATVVTRDTATGTPDASWGTFHGQPGVLAVTFAPPTTGVTMDPVVAVDTSTGTISTVWAGCGPTQTCTRWFARFAADGSAVGSPTSVATVFPIVRGYHDGSFLTGSYPGSYQWRGPSGANRDSTDVVAGTMADSTVDSNGKLLMITKDGSFTRWPVGADPELAMPAGCASTNGVAYGSGTGQGVAIGPTTDGGFAIACGSTIAASLVVARYDSAGTQKWKTTGQATGYAMTGPRAVTVDATDRVWVAGTTGYQASNLDQYDLVEPFTKAGAATNGYRRSKHPSGLYADGGITDLHYDHGVTTFADQETCCRTASTASTGFAPIHSGQLPFRRQVPACAVSNLSVTAASDDQLTVSFLPCPATSAALTPFGYRIAIAPGSAAPVAYAIGSPGTPTSVSMPLDHQAGVVSTITVTPYTDAGDSTVAPVSVVAVPPFTSIASFVTRQYHDLTPGASLSLVNSGIAQVTGGQLTPGQLDAQLLVAGPAQATIEPVARLYRAYFLRSPDLGGLQHWVGKSQHGMSFASMASQFAASSEFKNRYGPLSNAAFVAQLYQNVFGRAGDPSGLAFWTKRLDHHTNTKGQVVRQFSESSEGLRLAAPIVQPFATAYLMLGRLPTADERVTWAAFPAALLHQRTAEAILGTHEYAVRVAS